MSESYTSMNRNAPEAILHQYGNNTMHAFIKPQTCPVYSFKGTVVPGQATSGSADMGGGLSAVETIRTDDIFSMCSATESLDASSSSNNGKRARGTSNRRADDCDLLIGNIAPALGESSLCASAFTSTERPAVAPQSSGLTYNPRNFSRYR